jgi:hypothetical protein
LKNAFHGSLGLVPQGFDRFSVFSGHDLPINALSFAINSVRHHSTRIVGLNGLDLFLEIWEFHTTAQSHDNDDFGQHIYS